MNKQSKIKSWEKVFDELKTNSSTLLGRKRKPNFLFHKIKWRWVILIYLSIGIFILLLEILIIK